MQPEKVSNEGCGVEVRFRRDVDAGTIGRVVAAVALELAPRLPHVEAAGHDTIDVHQDSPCVRRSAREGNGCAR
jgi:hypothetical protein